MWFPEMLNKMSHFTYERPNDDVSLCSAILYNAKPANQTKIDVSRVGNKTLSKYIGFLSK